MRRLVATLSMILGVAASAAAQQSGMKPDHMMHAMGGCPLHLTTLGLSAGQQTAFDAIRTQHMTEMRTVPDSLRAAAMKVSMKSAVEQVRAILTPEQRKTFDAAVEEHEKHAAHGMAGMNGQCPCCANMGATMPVKPPAQD